MTGALRPFFVVIPRFFAVTPRYWAPQNLKNFVGDFTRGLPWHTESKVPFPWERGGTTGSGGAKTDMG